jgi:hypothetical protein
MGVEATAEYWDPQERRFIEGRVVWSGADGWLDGGERGLLLPGREERPAPAFDAAVVWREREAGLRRRNESRSPKRRLERQLRRAAGSR